MVCRQNRDVRDDGRRDAVARNMKHYEILEWINQFENNFFIRNLTQARIVLKDREKQYQKNFKWRVHSGKYKIIF